MKKSNTLPQPQGRAPTLEDVARAAGLSSMTVSRAINTPGVVRQKTLEKVQEAIRITGYIPNALAGSLASRRSKLIAVVVPQINNSMFVDTTQAISDELARRGYHMLLCVSGYTRETEEALVTALLSRRPDGVVLTGIHHSPALKKMILSTAVPVVEMWDLTPTPMDMLVGFSHEKVGLAIGEYLCRKGYQKPALIWTDDNRAARRRAGLVEVLDKVGICLTGCVHAALPATLERGRLGAGELLAAGVCDVIICSSDTLAQGAIMEAEVRGMKVPEDVAVIGFGDLDFAAWNRPSITTVGIDRRGMGERAAAMLAERIAGEPCKTPVMDLGFRLFERDSA